MLKFYGQSTNVYHYYYYLDENDRLYYWKSANSDVYNSCVECGKLVGINALEYEIKKNGKCVVYDGKVFTEIIVIKWEKCS